MGGQFANTGTLTQSLHDSITQDFAEQDITVDYAQDRAVMSVSKDLYSQFCEQLLDIWQHLRLPITPARKRRIAMHLRLEDVPILYNLRNCTKDYIIQIGARPEVLMLACSGFSITERCHATWWQ